MQTAGGLQNHFQENFAFNPQTPSLLSIDGSWLGKDFRGYRLGGGFCGMRPHRGRSRNIGIAEAALLNGGCGCAWAIDGGAVAKPRTCDDARYAFGPAGTIAVARSRWKIKRSECGDVDGFALTGFGGKSIRIAESSGLHLRCSAREGGSGRTASREYVRLHRLLGNHRRGVEGQRF